MKIMFGILVLTFSLSGFAQKVKIINDNTVPAGKQYKVGDACSPAKGTYQCDPVVNGTQWCGCREANN